MGDLLSNNKKDITVSRLVRDIWYLGKVWSPLVQLNSSTMFHIKIIMFWAKPDVLISVSRLYSLYSKTSLIRTLYKPDISLNRTLNRFPNRVRFKEVPLYLLNLITLYSYSKVLNFKDWFYTYRGSAKNLLFQKRRLVKCTVYCSYQDFFKNV